MRVTMRSLIPARFFLVLLLLAVGSPATLVGCGESGGAGSQSSLPPVPDELGIDPRTVDAAWILQRLDLGLSETERAEAISGAEALERILIRRLADGKPLLGLPEAFLRNRRDAAEDFDRGLFRIRTFEPIRWTIPVDWDRPNDGLTYLAELHSWRFLNDLLVAHQQTGDPKYFDAMEAAVLDWIDANPFDAPAHERAWHEGAISKRVLVLLNMLNHYRTRMEPSRVKRATLLALLIQHAAYLAWGEHYRPAGNHGIRQDIGQIAIALGLPEAKESDAWYAQACDRLQRLQFEEGFSREGVWREHSPGYHYYVVGLLDDLLLMLRENGRDASFFDDDLDRFRTYLAHVLTPGRLMPPVGDTDERKIRITPVIDGPSVRYAVSSGLEGTPPATLDGFFPDAGEVILRETWGNENQPIDESLYLHLRSAFHKGFGHRHQDDLSFVLFGEGRWWILEAGKWGYDKDPARDFVESASAHNTYTFNGRTIDPLDAGPGHAHALIEPNGVFTDEFAAVRAETSRFQEKNTRAKRTVVFLREAHTIVLLDELQSETSGNWTGYLHFPPDMSVDRPSSGSPSLLARAPTHPDLVLEILTQANGLKNLSFVRGQDHPLLGWYSPDFLELVPTTTAVFDRQGDDLLIATVIRLRHIDAPQTKSLETHTQDDLVVVRWREADQERTVTIDRRVPLAVTINGLEQTP